MPELTKAEVEKWVRTTNGVFTNDRIDKDMNIQTRAGRAARRTSLSRLVKEGVLSRPTKQDGVFRLVEEDAPEINFRDVDISKVLGIKWPFGLENWVDIYPKSVIVAAGDSDSGKTAFLLKLAHMNQDYMETVYFSSEMGHIEFARRLAGFDIPIEDWRIDARERSSNFADVIRPNALNIIDFLEVHEDFWIVAGLINEIWNKLVDGVAVIALQKNIGQVLGLGGGRSIEKPRLYLSIDNAPNGFHQLTIAKGKIWKDDHANPKWKAWQYKLVGGAKFVSITPGRVSIDQYGKRKFVKDVSSEPDEDYEEEK